MRRLALILAAAITTTPARAADDSAATPGTSAADAPSLASLLARSDRHAAAFEEMKRRASFTLTGRLEQLDRDGKVGGTKELSMRSTATPGARRTEILRYTEDGSDRTREARRDAEQRKGQKKKRDWRLPFLSTEQPRYAFSVSGRDAVHHRTRITFEPRAAAEDAFRGSAWIDEATGEIATLAFAPSKLPMFVDRLDVTVRFDLATPLGRAPSSVAIDVEGGLLLVHRHYRGGATLSDPVVAF